MTKKVNKLSKGHKFDGGSALTGAVGTFIPMISNGIQTTKGLDLTVPINQAQDFGNIDYNVGSVDDILNLYNSRGRLTHKDKYDFTGGNASTDLLGNGLGYATDVMSGALAGTAFAPGIGTAIGAAAAALLSGATKIIGAINTDKEVNKYNDAVDNSNPRNDWSVNNALWNTKYNDFNYISALGGPIFRDPFSNGVTEINEGGTHENNPHEGVPVGVAPDGLPNLVEEGEVIYKDYVFSNRLRVPEAIRKKYKLRGTKDITFAEAFRKAQEESEERENDPISKNGLDNIAMILARSQEAIRQKNMRHKKAEGGHLFGWGSNGYFIDKIDNTEVDEPDLFGYYNPKGYYIDSIDNNTVYEPNPVQELAKEKSTASLGTNWLRAAPIFANLGAVASDLMGITNRPTVYDQIPAFTPVGFKPITNYLPNTRIDTRYDANKQAQQAAATAAAIRQNFTPGKYGNLLAADLNAQIAQGNLLREAQLAQIELDRKREEFNRGTNQANSELALRTGLGNQGSRLSYAQAALQQAKANTDETNASMGARAANISGLADNIAGAATERDQRRWLQALAKAGVFGTLPIGFRVANGGRIRRKKKGLTC